MTDDTPTIDPQRAALLLMDYQAGILGRLPDNEALLTRATDALATARSRGVRVAYVRVALDEADVAAVPATNKTFGAMAAMASAMHPEAPSTAVHQQVAPQAGDIEVRKVRVGAFSTTDLDGQLRSRGIDTVILAGISTSGVVLSTVRDAADRDYRVYVLEDASADPDPEVHQFLTTKVFPRQAWIVSVADLPDLLLAR